VHILGELLAHPILETLRSTDKSWLVNFLYAFNTGDIVLFEQMNPQCMNIPDLATQEIHLRQKLSSVFDGNDIQTTCHRPAIDL
jgi:26S proteasome regulatory subunit N9